MRCLPLLLLLALCCAALHHERRIHLQNGVIDPLDPNTPARKLRSDGAVGEYLVQLKPPVTAQSITNVEKAIPIQFAENVRVPYHSFLALATNDQVLRLEAHPLVAWVGDFSSSYKYPASLQSWANTALAGSKSAEIVVALHSVTSVKAAEQLVRGWSVAIKSDLGLDMRVLRVTRADRAHVKVPTAKFYDAVQWIARQTGSLWVEPALEQRSFANQATGIVESGVPGSSSIIQANGIDGGGTFIEIVALADTGLDYNSCFFNTTSVPSSNFDVNADKIVVYNVDGGDTVDANGHGTAMAGLISGEPSGASAAYHGLAPQVKIAFTDISVGTAGTFTGPSDIISYMELVRNNYSSTVLVGAFGSSAPVSWYTTRDQDVDNYLYLFPTFPAIFAAGNFGQTSGNANVPGQQLASPAVAKNVISVGASQNVLASVINWASVTGNTTLTNNINADNSQYGLDVLAPFSSKGPAPDGRIKPDVVAPGMGLFGASISTQCGTSPIEGTSFSAALVAGAAVLIRQYLRAGYKDSGAADSNDRITPSAALVKAALINSGVGLSGYSAADGKFFGTNGQLPHPAYGFGRVQLSNVLYLTSPAMGTLTLWQDSTAGVKQGTTQQFCFDVTAGTKHLKVTLAWTDPLGSLVSGYVLTNNLDLLVMDPNGRTYFANGLTTFDSINNVEQVIVENPVVGSGWVALVHGLYVDELVSPNGQNYGMVVSGNVSASTGCPTRCPHACGGSTFGTCSAGVCTCATGRFGVDCSLTACPNNCAAADGSRNGICNPITSECECAPAFGGADCRLPANETTVTIVKGRKGLSNGAVAGIAVGTFFAGAILCGALGFVAAIQYLIWKRKNHKKLLEEGGGKQSGGSGL